MKYLKSYFIIALLMLGVNTAFTQGYQINQTNLSTPDSGNVVCGYNVDVGISAQFPDSLTTDISGVISGSNFQSSNIEAQVFWGDGTQSTHNGSVSSVGNNISFNPPLNHTYNHVGSKQIVLVTTNTGNNTSDSSAITIYIDSSCNAMVNVINEVDCDSNGTIETTIYGNVPYIFTKASNPNMVFYGTSDANGQIQLGNFVTGTYNYEIDPGWLASNGYSATYTPATINLSTNSTTTVESLLICDSTSSGNNACFSGLVFCDVDSNGTYDHNTDINLDSVPVDIYGINGNFTTSVLSGSWGEFYGSTNGNMNQFIVQVNQNWLTHNGYGNQYIVDTINANCNSIDTAFLALGCSGTPQNDGCIDGYVYCDANNNGSFDANESPLYGAPVSFYNLNQQLITVYSDSSGYYSYCGSDLDINDSIAVYLDQNQNWLTAHGYSYNGGPLFDIVASSTSGSNFGFAVDCGGGQTQCSDLWTAVNPWIGYFQNQNNYIRLEWGSYGPGAAGSYQLTLNIPSGVTLNTSSINNPNYVVNGNTITWTLNASSGYFFEDDVISFFTASGIPSGTVHQFSANISITGSGTDCCNTNNKSILTQVVGNSYDPNDKNVDLQEQIDPTKQDTLTYTVRFQNTGTAPAQNIFIEDTISSNLDMSTFEVLHYSHNLHVKEMGNNTLRFVFPDIWLPDSNANEPASHGYLTYRIVEKASNTEGSEIENTAHIFFDWNPAIVTNTTYNINSKSSSVAEEKLGYKVTLYPNPTQDNLNLRAPYSIERINVISMSGKVIRQENPRSTTARLNLNALSKGVYMIQVATEQGTSMHKVVVQ